MYSLFREWGTKMSYVHPLKIIWNITSKCGYNCEICATYSDRDELDFCGKKKILNSILSVGIENITEIDFAGGDPLFVADSIQVIHNAINVLGKEKVSVTTTGKGINNAVKMGENLSQLLYNCEVTIDCLDHISNLRKESSYVESNQNAIKCANKSIENLIINVPILNTEINNDTIRRLVDQIAEIDVSNVSVNLIRLMNVGRMDSHKYIGLYSPEHFVRTFTEYAKNTCIKNVHIHCALRGKLLGTQCNMLSEKIGIDCSGNVFACAWGGYVEGYDKYNICKNPFYIGNLLEKSLVEVLTDKRVTQLEQLIKKNPTNHCRVYNFENSATNDIFQDTDLLFKNSN